MNMKAKEEKLPLSTIDDLDDPNSEASKSFINYFKSLEDEEHTNNRKIVKLFSTVEKRAKSIENISEDDLYLLYLWCLDNNRDDNNCYLNNDVIKTSGVWDDGFFIIDNKWELLFTEYMSLKLAIEKL